ncbi:MAG: hypothetical protein LW650_08390 [Planctomycetaceae bacterium]|nr:hypothetical protein [Phycisphaerales bacterium]MCE2653499.1 hypothetical protein [Planctomycetaceae bacterium]
MAIETTARGRAGARGRAVVARWDVRLGVKVGVAAVAMLCGCSPVSGPDSSPDGRVRTLLATPREGVSEAEVDLLVRGLRSDDALARMVSIRRLEAIAGSDLGYRSSDPPRVREAAVEAWEAWRDERQRRSGAEGGAAEG